MSIVTLDFETYWDKDYSLSKMTHEEYINDPRFEAIGVAIKIGSGPATWVSMGAQALGEYLHSCVNWEESVLICHNSLFDGAILAWRFGIVPNFYADTLCMARALDGPDVSVSLANLVRRYKVGIKGDEVRNTQGLRLSDFSPAALLGYGEYCKNDTELTYALFKELATTFPAPEMALIDKTIRMFTQPSLTLDQPLLETRLQELKTQKSTVLKELMVRLDCADEESVRQKLASSKKFVEVLKSYGITAPTKLGKNGEIPALARTDLGFIALEEHSDPFVQTLAAARLGVKSTLEESRVQRFIDVAKRNRGRLPVPLKYYAAHPGRWGGTDKINLQNLPARTGKSKTLKEAICAPAGHYILCADLAQIEARILAWLAGETTVTELFRLRKDVYSHDASLVYGRTITKNNNPTERFVGKTIRLGLGYGTGPDKFRHTLEVADPPVKLSEQDCKTFVYRWRSANPNIVKLWDQGNQVLRNLLSWPEDGSSFYFGEHELIPVTLYGLRLPNGLYIRYQNVRIINGQIHHDSRKGPTKIWGGVVTENVVQALARLVMSHHMNIIGEKYKVVLTVHDALCIVIPKDQLEEAMSYVESVMSEPPDWAPGLPIAVDIKYGENYGEC